MMLNVNPLNRPNCDQLLSKDIVVNKMKEVHADIRTNEKEKISLIQTLKMPKKMKDINHMLPEKRYKEEMLMHDEYETKKNGFFNKNENHDNVISPKAQINLNSNNNNVDINELIKQHEQFKAKALDDKHRAQVQKIKEVPSAKKILHNVNNKPIVHHKIVNSKPSSNNNYNHKIKIVNSNPSSKRPISGVNKRPNIVIKKNPTPQRVVPKTPSSGSGHHNYNLQIKNPNYKVPSVVRPQSGKNPVVNNNKIAARKSPVSSNRPISSHQVPKKKVVYEKLNYNAYIANKKKAPAKKVVGYKPKIGNKK